MAKRNIDKNLFSGLKTTLDAQPETPTQKIVPVATQKKVKEEETSFTLWMPKSLMKQLKFMAVETEMTMKDIIIRAINKEINT